MLNIVEFRKRAPRARGSRPQRLPVDSATDVSALASRLTRLQTKARGEIHDAILLLDLATLYAQQLAKRMLDPAVKKQFEENISHIEQLLQTAKDLALKL
jgi:hypothetical protein